MHPEWLTSTVTAFARCGAESSSHSTRSFTLEMMRLWPRNFVQRSCKAAATAPDARLMAMSDDLTIEGLPGAGEGVPKLLRRIARVNSTFSKVPDEESPR